MPQTINPDAVSPQYMELQEEWAKVRHCMAGQRKVKDQKEVYLPRLDKQSENDYQSYLGRAIFFNTTSRTMQGLLGLLFQRDPALEGDNDQVQAFSENVTGGGVTLRGFSEEVAEELLSVGRIGLLIEFPDVPEGLTQAQAERMRLLPYFVKFTTEDILRAHTKQVGGQTVLSMVRVREWVEKDGEGEFDKEVTERIRVLDLDELDQYRVRLYEPIKKKSTGKKDEVEWEQVGDDKYPIMNGQFMDFIPFVFINTKNTRPDHVKPTMIDLADINIAHYQTHADYSHAVHYTALPTPVVSGGESEKGYTIGPSEVIELPQGAEMKWLELTGKGLEAITKKIDYLEQYMASLGVRILVGERAGVETAEALSIKRQSETSMLSAISNNMTEGITMALHYAAIWMGIEESDLDDVVYRFSSRFIATQLDARTIDTLMKAYQQQTISYGDFIHALQEGNILRAERSAEDIISDIQSEPRPED